MIKKKSLQKSIKMILLFGALPVAVLFTVIGLAILLQSSFYNETSLIDKRVIVSDDEQHLLIVDSEDEVFLRYSIKDWREGAEAIWFDYSFADALSADNFTEFRGVSALPESDRELIFSVTGILNREPISLFTVLDVGSQEMKFFEEIVEGEVGNIVWSPEKNYFAYFTNNSKQEGILLLVNSVTEFSQVLRVDRSDLFSEATIPDYAPGFRMMQWSDDQEELFFTVNGSQEEEVVRMKLSISNGEVSVTENQ